MLWVGLIIGVSFIATPAKFLAPNLTLPAALEVGKVTFHIFNKIEWIFCITVVMLAIVTPAKSLPRWLFAGGMLMLLFLETFFLLPALDARINFVIANKIANFNPSILHWFYISVELLKVGLASIGGWYLIFNK